MHIELRRWADVVVLAPASANTLAKMTAGKMLFNDDVIAVVDVDVVVEHLGICDSMLLSFFRAMNEDCAKILCPAMNTK